MEWFYALGNDRKGPVDEQQLRALVSDKTIGPDTLVWNSTLPAWQPYSSVGLPPTLPADVPRCFITGKAFPASQMIQTEHGWVSAEARDVYYQCLREGAPFPLAAGLFNARADGKYVVVPATGAQFPLRCVKTNESVTSADIKHKKLYWCSPWVFVSILLNILILLILYLVLRKAVKLDIPVSAAGRRIVRKHMLFSLGLTFGGLALIIAALASSSNMSDTVVAMLVIGIPTFLGGLIYAAIKIPILRVAKLKNNEAWLLGACPEFVSSLPAYVPKA